MQPPAHAANQAALLAVADFHKVSHVRQTLLLPSARLSLEGAFWKSTAPEICMLIRSRVGESTMGFLPSSCVFSGWMRSLSLNC